MSEAAHLAREAKGLHQGLKELLKTHNPGDKEVEFSRRKRHYLRLLLVEPYAKESKDAETHLWMQTSYQFISHYKQNLATLERTLQSAPRHQQRQAGHGPVEYRKLMQRFRQFLSDEEKFWTQFIVRYQRSFQLQEAHPILVALQLVTPAEDTESPKNGTSNQGRHQFVFPPEDSVPAPDPAQHASRLAILSKAIVCLGDIARYRELYNESGGRPKAGHEDGTTPAKRGKGHKGVPGLDVIPRARNYDKAIQCYEQARFLVPYEGNSSHQLAILAFYQGDMFSSLFHYYRALCVRQPYDTASENVKKILHKALDQQAKKNAPIDGDIPPRLRVEYFKENVVLLHALWRLGSDKSSLHPIAHANQLAQDFYHLVSERILPIDMVSKVIVLAQGALWNHRMIHGRSSQEVEYQMVTHVLAMHRVLLEMGAEELAVPPEDAAENDLAQRITAPFRRTLPALRIASKWLVANVRYVVHAARDEDKGVRGIPLFWIQFARFHTALANLFPVERLPALTMQLDEDVDLKGFLPLRDLLDGVDSSGRDGHASLVKEKVHPNEEQLMRIWDLLKDAKVLAESEKCPIQVEGQVFVYEGGSTTLVDVYESVPEVSGPINVGVVGEGNEREQEEDVMTDTGRTEDDPVRDAFREVLDDQRVDEEEDGEVIVFDPRPPWSPPGVGSLPLPATVNQHNPTKVDTIKSSVSPGKLVQTSPMIVPGTTAQDLLNNVMSSKRGLGGGTADAGRVRPLASFPFGLGPSAPPSIWSTSLDQAAIFPGHGHSSSVGSFYASSPPLETKSSFAQSGPYSSVVQSSGQVPPSVPSLGTPSQARALLPTSPSLNTSSGRIPVGEYRQGQWPSANMYDVPLMEPVHATTGLHYPPSGFSNGHGLLQHSPPQQSQTMYGRLGQHQKSASLSRTWGIHG